MQSVPCMPLSASLTAVPRKHCACSRCAGLSVLRGASAPPCRGRQCSARAAATGLGGAGSFVIPALQPTAAAALARWAHTLQQSYNSPIPFAPLQTTGKGWSVRVGVHYRAVAAEIERGYLEIWIETHAEYDKLRVASHGGRADAPVGQGATVALEAAELAAALLDRPVRLLEQHGDHAQLSSAGNQ